MEKLSNHFLISMPHIADPIFSKSLIYLCEHNSSGSMGIIVNKPMVSENTATILQKTGLEKIEPMPEIYFGGPVNIEMGLILHNSDYKIDGTLNVSNNISLTSNKQIISDLKAGNGPSLFRFSLGYTGWGKGQLNKEIENGDWLVIPADLDFIFTIPDVTKWEKTSNKLGIDISTISGSAGIA